MSFTYVTISARLSVYHTDVNIHVNENNSGLEDDTSISSKSNMQIDRWTNRESQMLEHTSNEQIS